MTFKITHRVSLIKLQIDCSANRTAALRAGCSMAVAKQAHRCMCVLDFATKTLLNWWNSKNNNYLWELSCKKIHCKGNNPDCSVLSDSMLCIFKNNSLKGHCRGEKAAGRIYLSFEFVPEQMSEKGWGRLINFCNDSRQASSCNFPSCSTVAFSVLEETLVF